jgi:hypothetical protein
VSAATTWPPEIRHLPIDERWQLPVPYIVERPNGVPNFGILDPRRAIQCYQERLCAMCGLKMGAEVALYGDVVSLDPDGFYIEAPTHERCMEIALTWPVPPATVGGVCPFISRQNYRRRRVDDPDVVVLGDRDRLHEVGREIAKRASVVAIAERYQMATMLGPEGNMPVYLTPGGVVRVRTFAWVDGFARELLADPPPEPARRVTVVRTQRRRQPRSRRQ